MRSSKPSNHPYLTMAKGNMLLGYARGAVGNLVFSRVKGNEVTKARNRQPANPKTSKQVYQRAKFLNSVNFYKRGVQNLFKFAYEDKTQQESDFNAFMRHNVSRAIPVGKNSATESVYPAISNWITSVGSLNGPQAAIGFDGTADELTEGRMFALGTFNEDIISGSGSGTEVSEDVGFKAGFKLSSAVTTFGNLCSQLKAQYPDLQEGDIVTITLIHQIIQGIGEPLAIMPSAYGSEGAISAPAWRFAQFAIDSSSTKPIAQAWGNEIYLSEGMTGTVDGANVLVRVPYTWQQAWDDIMGGTFDADSFTCMSSCTAAVMTFSRTTSSGLRVSTQELSTSEGFQKMIELSQTTSFTESVLRSWDAADTAILEGSFIQA